MSPSKEPTTFPNLHSLNQAFLTAFEVNDLDGLAKVHLELSHLVSEVANASSSKNLISTDQVALELSLFSHNVNITSMAAEKARLEIDELTSKFTQQLNLLPRPPLPSASGQLASTSTSPSIDLDSACPSNTSLVLKQWCSRHMSYLFPSKEEVEELALQTAMSQGQVNLWFRNSRTRSGWSKVFAHPKVSKDPARLEALLKECDSLKCQSSPENFKSFLARDELFKLLDKAVCYFAPTKQSKSRKPDSIRPWVKEVLSSALATLKDKTAGALDSSRQKLPSLPSRKRARTKKIIPSPSPLSQSSTSVAGPSSIPSPALESSCSSLSLPTTIASFSDPSPIQTIDFSPILGSPSSDSLYSGHSSPGPVPTSSPHLLRASPVFSSLPRACIPVYSVPSLSPGFETSEMTSSNSDPTRNSSHLTVLTITHPPTAPTTVGPDPDQFEDAEED